VGLKDITKKVNSTDLIVFNGETGEVFVNLTDTEIQQYQNLKTEFEKAKKELEKIKNQPSVTLDGRKVELAGNIGTPQDIQRLVANDVEGVGLYRTEFIYMDRDSLPTEEEQFNAYKEVLEALNPKPVIIRTLDVGGDKRLPYLNIDEEMNPFLGYRAIRLCLNEPDIFNTQLRALLRASVYGNLKIMFPMISSLEELLSAKKILSETKLALDKEDIAYANNIEIGMMIEVPSAAIISDILAEHVDFFSIGTNDLIQYTCAVDRMNEKLHHLYNPFNPAVLRLIKMVIENGHKAGIWVGMCGEMAGDKGMIPILLGLGLDEFSMSASSVLPARKLIRSLNFLEMQQMVDKILSLETGSEIEEFIEKFRANRVV
ncbi:MAG: phosphoenolpyruvate--protein phosphotransferase, partial [Desulfobacterales bacterium]|nr:phosphoenolpyruvate--protein phosphotransferase [Desulfobacterales bacterium]